LLALYASNKAKKINKVLTYFFTCLLPISPSSCSAAMCCLISGIIFNRPNARYVSIRGPIESARMLPNTSPPPPPPEMKSVNDVGVGGGDRGDSGLLKEVMMPGVWM
jgi:hypothetical protein